MGIGVPVDELKWRVSQKTAPFQGFLQFVGEQDEAAGLIKEFVESIPLPSAEASVFECVKALLCSGHPYTVAGSVLLFVCVIICPLVEALCGCIVATTAQCSNQYDFERSVDGDDEVALV